MINGIGHKLIKISIGRAIRCAINASYASLIVDHIARDKQWLAKVKFLIDVLKVTQDTA